MPAQRQVAALFVRSDSVYKSITGVDCYDRQRDALTFPGGIPVVAHPPCRAWGRLRRFAMPRPDERPLALWAMAQVRSCGGVLEHPWCSTLFFEAGCPGLEREDAFGGYCINIPQFWFGHRALKRTTFYVVGVPRRSLPSVPLKLGQPSHVVASSRRSNCLPHVTRAEREGTPALLAKWLVDLARLV